MEVIFQPDIIIVGTSLAGLTSAMEINNAGKKVLLLDQETEQNMGGQAFLVIRRFIFNQLTTTAQNGK
ncbi:FAD-binding protein [Sphingobacterium corticibacter]|uniref:FAD-binding protein n=1 Tax=Sphingobacterium corticibacter TaxID=2171749 RepID=UPI001A9C6B14|nr:FAD-binding protein [Sphingobacterium corticibacter]